MLKFVVPQAAMKWIVYKSVSVDHLSPRILTFGQRIVNFAEVFQSFVRICCQAAGSFSQWCWGWISQYQGHVKLFTTSRFL